MVKYLMYEWSFMLAFLEQFEDEIFKTNRVRGLDCFWMLILNAFVELDVVSCHKWRF